MTSVPRSAARSLKKKASIYLSSFEQITEAHFFFALRAQTIILSFRVDTQERYTDFQI